MSTPTMRDMLVFIAEHPDAFMGAIDKKSGEVDFKALEVLALRGDALTILERKTTFDAEARNEFLDSVFSLVADYAAGMNKSVKASNRFGFLTPSGYKVTVSLEPETNS